MLGGPLIAVRRALKGNKAIGCSSAPRKADEEPSESASVSEKRGDESVEERPLILIASIKPLSIMFYPGATQAVRLTTKSAAAERRPLHCLVGQSLLGLVFITRQHGPKSPRIACGSI